LSKLFYLFNIIIMSFEKLIVFPFPHLLIEYLNNEPLCPCCNNCSNDLVQFMLVNKSIYNYFKNNFWKTNPLIRHRATTSIMSLMPGYTYNYLRDKEICSEKFESTLFDDFSRAVRCIKNCKSLDNMANPMYQQLMIQKKLKLLKENGETFKIGNNEYMEESIHFLNANNVEKIKFLLKKFSRNIIITDNLCCGGKGMTILFKI